MAAARMFFPKVSDIAHMGVVMTSVSSPVATAVRLMEANNLSDVIFERDGGHAIFTVEDLMLFRSSKRSLDTPLSEVFAHPLAYVDGSENVLNLMKRLDGMQNRYLGVLDEHKQLVGVVSASDVMASVDPVLIMERKKLSDILSKRRIDVVDITTSTEAVLSLLINAEDAVLVAQEAALVGILTTKDAVRLIRDAVDTYRPVGDYMSAPLVTLSEDETVKNAITHLKNQHFKRAVVVDGCGNLCGVVTQSELINITYGRWAELMKMHAHELGELVQVLESENQRLQHESLVDALTGVGNRRHFNHCIEAEIGRFYRQTPNPFSVLLLDIDFFKKINDAHGHLRGDQVLKALAGHVASLLRVSDEVCRWGGEEFAVVLPSADRAHAGGLAERIRSTVEATRFDGLVVTVSVGVAQYQRGQSLDELMAQADAALYAAKQGGRNRVVLAPADGA